MVLLPAGRVDHRIACETDPNVTFRAEQVGIILILAQSVTTDQVWRLVRDPIPLMEFKASIFVQQLVTDLALQRLTLHTGESGDWFIT